MTMQRRPGRARTSVWCRSRRLGCARLALSLPLAGIAVLVYIAFVRAPTNSPRAFITRGRQPRTRRLVVAVGASPTHASLSAEYVALLRCRFGAAGYEFVNAGRNGNTSADVLRRMDEVVACQPDIVTILLGTNDVRHAFTHPRAPTAFGRDLEAIISRVRTQTRARIALLSLPPLGEDTASAINQVVQAHNHIMQRLAVQYGTSYLPVYESFAALLAQAHQVQPQPYRFRPHRLFLVAVRRYLLRQSWDAIATAHRMVLLTDQIHLSDYGARVIADLIGAWLHELDGTGADGPGRDRPSAG